MRARPVRLRHPIAWVAFLVGAACADAPSAPTLAPRDAPTANATADYAQTIGFRRAVTLEAVRAHQSALQAIADANAGLRRTGTPGGDASEAYAHARMTAAGYVTAYETFSFTFAGDATPPMLQQLSPVSATYAPGTDFRTLSYSGSGDVTAPVVAVDLQSGPPTNSYMSGCEAADFAGFPAGSIALIQRGFCLFEIKAQNARAAGAVAVVIFNDGSPGRTDVFGGTLAVNSTVAIPVVGTSYAVGQALRNGFAVNGPTGVTARVRVDYVVAPRTGRNVIAESPGGDPEHAVVVGARLDGDAFGPAINAVSGAAAALAIAEAFAAQERTPTNRLRFVFFSGSADGLLGAEHHVAQLSPQARARIAAMVGLEAIGSPNFGRFVLDGATAAEQGLEALVDAYFGQAGLATEPIAAGRRAEEFPFREAGIPATALFTGTFEVKTAAQAALFGGVAGAAFDPCRSEGCDTYANVSSVALDQMSDAAAHTVLLLSRRSFARRPLAAP